MRNVIAIGVILFVFSLAGYHIYNYVQSHPTEPVDELQTIYDEPIMLSDYIGKKKTILQFVAVPCDCCSFSMPFVKEFTEEQDEIEVITIVFYGQKSQVIKKFTEEYKVTHKWGLDLKKRIANYYGAKASPTYVFFDEHGNKIGTYPFIIANKEELRERYETAYEEFHAQELEQGEQAGQALGYEKVENIEGL